MGSRETKIECQCGRHFKFDLEPVAGHGPQGLSCPSCGSDATQACEAFLHFLRGQTANLATSGTRALKEINVACGCGTRLKLDLELSDQTAPTPVSCSSCHADLTGRANELIGRYTVEHAIPEVPASRLVPPAATLNHAPHDAGNRTAPAHAPHRPHTTPAGTAARQRPGAATPRATQGGALRPALTGALGGAVLGAVVWFGVVMLAGPRANWLALLPGLLAGLGARFAGRGSSPCQGVAAAGVALIGYVVMALVLTVAVAKRTALPHIHQAYQAQLALAKAAVAVKNDQDLRRFVGETSTNATVRVVYGKLGPGTISDHMLTAWKQTELPKLRALADGSYSRAQFTNEHWARTRAALQWGRAFFTGFGGLGLLFATGGLLGAIKLGSG